MVTRLSIWLALVLAWQSALAADLTVGFNIDRPPYVDRFVFNWYRRQLAGTMKTDDEVEYHDIFPHTTVFAAAFADRDLRDRFNAALKAMRADGAYQDIVSRYR